MRSWSTIFTLATRRSCTICLADFVWLFKTPKKDFVASLPTKFIKIDFPPGCESLNSEISIAYPSMRIKGVCWDSRLYSWNVQTGNFSLSVHTRRLLSSLIFSWLVVIRAKRCQLAYIQHNLPLRMTCSGVTFKSQQKPIAARNEMSHLVGSQSEALIPFLKSRGNYTKENQIPEPSLTSWWKLWWPSPIVRRAKIWFPLEVFSVENSCSPHECAKLLMNHVQCQRAIRATKPP